MLKFGKDFLQYMGHAWQKEEVLKWRVRHIYEKSDFGMFVARVQEHNEDARSKRNTEIVNEEEFAEVGGSLGAIDGTYSIRTEIHSDILAAAGIDPTHDVMYTEYKKCHAHKILIFVSHSIDSRKEKFILGLQHAPGGASDGSMAIEIMNEARAHFLPGVCALGDHAFHTCQGIICGYSATDLKCGNVYTKTAFNSSLSSDRMTSEHGVMYLKQWGIFRGRDDITLFEDETNFLNSLNCVWSLHNWIMLKCPRF